MCVDRSNVFSDTVFSDAELEAENELVQESCEHHWEEMNIEPPYDVCLSCGKVRH